MASIVIAYYSKKGRTKKLAECVAEGIESLGKIKAELCAIENLDQAAWEKMHQAQAIVFGSPTYMGSVAGPFKSFMDKTGDFWVEQKWANKIGAGFTLGTNSSGDKLNSLVQLAVFSAQHGMIWVGQNQVGSQYTHDDLDINDAGSWLGLMAQTKNHSISEADIRTAKLFGERIARVTLRWGLHD